MVSRATLLTGQYMSRHGIDRVRQAAYAGRVRATPIPGVLRRAGYWTRLRRQVRRRRAATGGLRLPPRLRRQPLDRPTPTASRVHVTEKNARDAIDFLRDSPEGAAVLADASASSHAHAEDNAPEQYLPAGVERGAYEGATIPPPLRGDPRYMAALPPFLSNDANEGRVRYHWRFDTPERYQAYMTRYYRLITEVDARHRPRRRRAESPGRLRATRSSSSSATTATSRPIAAWPTSGIRTRSRFACRWSSATPGCRWRARRHARCSWRSTSTSRRRWSPPPAAACRPVMQGQDLEPALPARDRRRPWRDEFFYEHPTITSKDRIPSSQGGDPPRLEVRRVARVRLPTAVRSSGRPGRDP